MPRELHLHHVQRLRDPVRLGPIPIALLWLARAETFGRRAWREPARVIAALALLGVAFGACLHADRYSEALIDDAFITFRHAMNLVRGRGFTCNPGERIEGTSSFFLALLTTIPVLLDRDPLAFSQFVGKLSFAGCTVAAYSSVRACIPGRGSRLLAVGAAATVATSSQLAFHSQSGLETVLYSFLVATAMALVFRRFVARRNRGSAWALVMGIASITRPEGAVFFALLLVLTLPARVGEPSAGRAIARDLGAFFLVFAPVVLFRWLYFGSVVPTPVLAKSGSLADLAHHLRWELVLDALGYKSGGKHHEFLATQAIGAVLTCCTVLLPPVRLAGVVIGGIALGCLAVFMGNGLGADWMPYQRLMTPAVVPLAVGLALGLRSLFFHPAQDRHVCALFAAAVLVAAGFYASRPLKVQFSPIVYSEMRDLGRRLAKLKHPDDVMASDMGGVLPYFWDIKVIDTWGLCDGYLARDGELRSGIGRGDVSYVAGQRPTFLVFTFPIGAAGYFQDPGFARYRGEYLLLKWPWWYYTRPHDPVSILIRKERPGLQAFADALQATLVDPEGEFRRVGLWRSSVDRRRSLTDSER